MAVRILVLGTGSMAAKHVDGFRAHPKAEIVAGIDTDADRLAAFNSTHGIGAGFTNLEEALDWGAFDAVANVTPDPVHHPTTLAAIAGGKHVFCEKPLAENYADALEMTEAAERAGLVNMVNLRYRTIPAISRAAELVAEGAIGEVRHMDASYLQSWLVANHWGDWKTEQRWLWRLSSAHGSKGTMGDIGIHILDAATMIAGHAPKDIHCRMKTFDKASGNRIGEYGLDVNDGFVMSVGLEGGAIGTVHATRFAPGYANALTIGIYGTAGGLEVWFEKEEYGLRTCTGEDVHSQTWHEVKCPEVPTLYTRFVDAVIAGKGDMPDFRRAAEMQKVLDLCFVSDGDGKSHRA